MDIQKKFRASPDESNRWAKALEKGDSTLSKICRDALNRFAARVEKKATQADGEAVSTDLPQQSTEGAT